jgi:hypothetical protein
MIAVRFIARISKALQTACIRLPTALLLTAYWTQKTLNSC